MIELLWYIGCYFIWKYDIKIDRFLRRIPQGVDLDNYLKVLEVKHNEPVHV